MDILDICTAIKKIYLQGEKTIDTSNPIVNQFHDEQAIEQLEKFIIELSEYKGKTKSDLNSYINYLNSKYLASCLDSLESTIQVKIIRKTIAKILDSIDI
jgi:ribosomal protein L29